MAAQVTLEMILKATDQASAQFARVSQQLGVLNAAVSPAAHTNISKFNSALTASGLRATALGGQLSMLTTGIGGLSFASAGAAVAVGGLAIGIGKGLKSAIDFERSFARVKKTVEGTDEEFARLADANRLLSRELGINVNEINRIGEIGGQLGVAVGGIDEFARAIATLNITTNVSVEDLARSLGVLTSVMGINMEDIGRVGSALTELGNNYNSTEQDILDFSVRFAGAAEVLGIGIADVLAISNAFSSVGVAPERGGTAVQKILFEIQKAAFGAGEEAQKTLALFAALAGESSAGFRELLSTEPTEAFIKVLEGLGQTGDDAIPILEALGLADARVAASMLSAASADGLLRNSMVDSRVAALENTAAEEELQKQLNTTSAQMNRLKSNINDIFISIGDFFNPAFREAVEAVNDFLDGLRESESLKNFGANMVLLGQGIQILWEALQPVRDAIALLIEKFNQLPEPIQKVILALGLLSNPIGWLIGIIGLLTVDWVSKWNEIASTVEGVVNPILAAVTVIANVVGGIAVAIFNTAQSWASNWQNIVAAVGVVAGPISAVVGTIMFLLSQVGVTVGTLKSLWSGAWGGISGVIQTAASVIGGVLQGIVDAIAQAAGFIDGFIGKINSIGSNVGGWLGKIPGAEKLAGALGGVSIPTLGLEAPTISLGRTGGGPEVFGPDISLAFKGMEDAAAGAGDAANGAALDFDAIAAALDALSGEGGGAGGGGGSIPKAVNDLQALAGAFAEWHDKTGGSLEAFVAHIELAEENGKVLEETAEQAFRSRVELNKLAIVLGEKGITGEAFQLMLFMDKVGDSFQQAGVDISDAILGVLSAVGDFSSQMIQWADRLIRRADERGETVTFSTDYIGPNGEVISEEQYQEELKAGRGGQYTRRTRTTRNKKPQTPFEEGLSRLRGVPSFQSGTTYVDETGMVLVHEGEAVIPADINPWGRGRRYGGMGGVTNNYYGPVTNNSGGSYRDRRESATGLR